MASEGIKLAVLCQREPFLKVKGKKTYFVLLLLGWSFLTWTDFFPAHFPFFSLFLELFASNILVLHFFWNKILLFCKWFFPNWLKESNQGCQMEETGDTSVDQIIGDLAPLKSASAYKKAWNSFADYIFSMETKYSKAPMGYKYLDKIPKDLAEALNLENPVGYTGHSFRRSSATHAADEGASSVEMRRHYNWKDDTIANKYIEETLSGNRNMAQLMTTRNGQVPSVPQSYTDSNTQLKKAQGSIALLYKQELLWICTDLTQI